MSHIKYPKHYTDRTKCQLVDEEDRSAKIKNDVFMRSTEENPYLRKVQSTTELCSELKEEARRKFLESKRRQQLREENQELKELEAQIRTACINKALQAQIYENEALRKLEEVKAHESNVALQRARLQEDEKAEKSKEEKQAKQAAFKQDLQEQIALTNASRMKKYEDVLEANQKMEELVRKTRAEEKQEALDAIERKKTAQAELSEFRRAQEESRRTLKEAEVKEEEKAREVIRQRELKLQREAQEKKELQRRKQEISEKIGQQTYELASEKTRRNDLLVELLVDESQAKEEIRERNDVERRKQHQIDVRYQLDLDREAKERQKLKDKKMEEEFLQEQMRIFADSEKILQLSDEKRRRKQLEYRRELQKCLDDRKRLKAAQTMQVLHQREMESKDDARRQQLVEEERIKMLKEYGPGLMGFFAPGVLRDSDKEFLSIPSRQN